jgi:eukaryotic-like serine/threonine-protein kinase
MAGICADRNLFDLACAQSLLAGVGGEPGPGLSAAEARARADRAMDTLRRAVAAGYRDLANMRKDADLDALRSRADFQLLMMDAGFPEKPFIP